MNSDINLLANRDKEQSKEKSRVRKIRFAAFFVLLFVAFSSIASFFLNHNYTLVKNEEDALLQKMSLLHDKEAKLAIVEDRLKYIAQILHKRVSFAKTTKTLLDKIPQGIDVDQFVISQGSVSMSFSSTSLISLNTVIKNFSEMAHDKEVFKSLTMTSLVLVPQTGKYLLTLKGSI